MTTTTTHTIDPEQARREDELVRDHVRLVHYVVAEIRHRVPGHVARSDLVSAGMLGLAQAARTFDPARGVAFDRYASTRIRGALLDELRGRDWASRSVRARARGLRDATDALTARLGRTPTVDEAAAELGVDADELRRLDGDLHRATVLNYEALVTDGEADAFLVADDGDDPAIGMLDREQRAYLTDAIAALPPRLRHVVIAYFFEERQMQDIADELGVSESRISQLRSEALELLRDGINAQLDPAAVRPEARPVGRVARRKAAYYAAVASVSDAAARVALDAETVQDKARRVDARAGR